MKHGKRIADDQIYLNEDRFSKPKEMFKFIYSLIPSEQISRISSVVDVGCATGEFLYFLKNKNPRLHLSGCDVSREMLGRAERIQPDVNFFQLDLLEESNETELGLYDLVSCIGVLQIFDDIEGPTHRIIDFVKPGGMLIIAGSFNNHDVDVLMQYRRNSISGSVPWETGWNLFSEKTFNRLLEESSRSLAWAWHDFQMPFPIEEQEDPMRSWTIKTEGNACQLINGAAQLLYTKVLVIRDIEKK